MADPNIKISITADDKASAKLKDLDSNVGKTGDGMGKLGTAALAGAAAVVALGVKSVMAFEDTGLAVGKMADATGLTADAASRLIEIGGDIGISQGTLETSIGKMSKALGANKDAFKEYGIEVQHAKDGTVDVNETFLTAVDRVNAIEDPLKRAEAAAKIFGKGYQGMSELLGQSSDEIRADLQAVSEQKVFDDKKVEQARELREAFDTIVDSAQDLLLTIGQALAPVIAKLAPTLAKVIEVAAPLAESIGEVLAAALETLGPIIEGLLPVIKGLATALGGVADVIGAFKPTGFTKDMKEVGASLEDVMKRAEDAGLSTDEFRAMLAEAAQQVVPTGDHFKDLAAAAALVDERLKPAATSMEHMGIEAHDAGNKIEDTADQTDTFTTAADRAKRAVEEWDAKWQAMTGELDSSEALRNIADQFDEITRVAAETAAGVAEGSLTQEQANRQNEASVDGLKRKIIEYGKEILGLPPEKVTRLNALVDEGSLAEVERRLAILARNRTMALSIVAKGGSGVFTVSGIGAEGGIVTRPTQALIGEAGPEAVIPLNQMPGASPLPSNLGNAAPVADGGVTNNYFNVYTGADPNSVIRIVKQAQKRGEL